MKIVNNCEELVNFLINEFNDYPLDVIHVIQFQGEECEITNCPLDYLDIGVMKGGLLIALSVNCNGYFDVYCIKGIVHFNRIYPCITLPVYCRQEFLEALRTYKI